MGFTCGLGSRRPKRHGQRIPRSAARPTRGITAGSGQESEAALEPVEERGILHGQSSGWMGGHLPHCPFVLRYIVHGRVGWVPCGLAGNGSIPPGSIWEKACLPGIGASLPPCLRSGVPRVSPMGIGHPSIRLHCKRVRRAMAVLVHHAPDKNELSKEEQTTGFRCVNGRGNFRQRSKG